MVDLNPHPQNQWVRHPRDLESLPAVDENFRLLWWPWHNANAFVRPLRAWADQGQAKHSKTNKGKATIWRLTILRNCRRK